MVSEYLAVHTQGLAADAAVKLELNSIMLLALSELFRLLGQFYSLML